MQRVAAEASEDIVFSFSFSFFNRPGPFNEIMAVPFRLPWISVCRVRVIR